MNINAICNNLSTAGVPLLSGEAGVWSFGNETDIESRYELVFAKIANQDYNGATSCLASIQGMIDAEQYPEEMERFNNMWSVLPILIFVESGNIEWENIEPQQKDYLIDLCNNDRGMPGSIARAARMQFDPEYVYEEPIYIAGEIPMKKPAEKKPAKSIINPTEIKISPHPAVEFITVSYTIDGVINGLHLVITDALGKIVYEKELAKSKDDLMLVVLDYAKGNYICTIYNNGKPAQNTKFIKK